jgi:K+-sensing histidine kinase KdpD
LEDLLPLAEVKHIDIGVEDEHDVQVLINETDLLAVIKNLVDNAIRYTPAGGRVDLSVGMEAGGALLQVKDSGPCISGLGSCAILKHYRAVASRYDKLKRNYESMAAMACGVLWLPM